MTCNGGTKRRERFCTRPRPSNGGKDCPGDGVEVVRCNTKPCAGKASYSFVAIDFRRQRSKHCALLSFVSL